MVKTTVRRLGGIGLAAMILFTEAGMADTGFAAVMSPVNAPVTVTPFPGQWKYYGQTRKFIEDEHYSLSAEPAGFSENDWSLGLASEETGSQPFILQYHSENVDASKLTLAANAPRFEIREYKAPVSVDPDPEYHNISEYTIPAPGNYEISAGKDSQGNWNWMSELEIEGLHEGENDITYYLRSRENDNTKNAIDQTPRSFSVLVDTVAPVLSSLKIEDVTDTAAVGSVIGNEPGKFYYMALPTSGSVQGNAVTADLIQDNVASGRCIGGYGRVDGTGVGTEIKLTGLMAETSYTVYAFMEDKAGNCSPVIVSESVTTDKTALSGAADVIGEPAVDNTLTAVPRITSVDPGTLSYQWYRIRLDADDAKLNEDEDVSGDRNGLPAEDGEDDPAGRELTIDDAEPIPGATAASYKVTREDIGCRLIVGIQGANYSGYVAGATAAFVPKLIPAYSLPVVAKKNYSPTGTLASVRLPAQWSWVDDTLVPEYGNEGYRARFTPEDTAVYKTVIVRIRVPMTRRTLKKSMVRMKASMAYTGKAIRDNFTVKDQGKSLTSKQDFTVSYQNNKKPGRASVTFKGRGNYTGTVKVSYTIKEKSIENVTYICQKNREYNGKKQSAGLVLKNGSVRLRKNQDYTLSYKDNKEIGRASVTVRGIGNYRGRKTVRFSIVPSEPSVKAVKRTSGAFRLTLEAKQKVTGYQIYVSPTAAFPKKTTRIFMTTGTSFGMDNLAKGDVYYVRAKAYLSKDGKKYVSAYSKAKKIKIK
ncbi:MAG TPA: hypothetical protein DF613_15820 [Lachnospiraceae bacterium]|nr:hypothetical protein [Lachnospiraceae bacterium]